ncbi:MAG TPA: Holliday junction branch migration protein RuvA [Planctomycetota bacterium]|nr:Holliday junction branch migration protein RuvA [Planctomycetota bacterium]
MYNHIAGVLEWKTSSEAVVDAGGVGYLLRIPLSTSSSLPAAGQKVKLLAHLHVTDEAHTLYGFLTPAEREFFLQLISVDRVGPKVALSVLSGGRVQDIQQAIRLGDYAALKRIKGVGEGTAKKIVLELGKILIHQASSGDAAPKSAPAAKTGIKPVIEPGLDQDTELAVKAVMQLQEVPQDQALQAVQRAYAELSGKSATRPAVQDIIQRAMRFTG